MSKLDKIIKEKKIHHFEGESGVRNLARLCRALGYKDSQYFGQFAHDGCYGDLINFLEDNPGAVEAVVDFMRENEDGYIEEDEEEGDEQEEEDE